MALDIDLDVFRNRLADCKDRSQNLHFGVSSKSLKVEEHRQQLILQELLELENNLKYKDDRTNRTAAQILDIKDEVESGISSLKYLGGISNLENLYSELTGNIGACALHQSVNQNFSENMLVNKSLSNNVNDCWNYITKLAYLSQVHLRNASQYHQFHHDINEISALLKKRWKVISNQIANFEPKGTIKESDQLANNLKDHQSYFLHLWTRIDNLQIESKKIVPIHLRQDPVSQNKVLGQCLYSYSSPEISVHDREEVVILNNSNPLTWKIQNNKGEVGEIPSVCIWIPGPDVISSEKPISLRTQLTKNWEQCLNRFSIVLIDHYINLFERLLNEPNISVSKIDYFNNLLRDVQEVLLMNLTDVKSKELGALLVELQKRVNSRNSNDSRNSHVYKESEIIKMHTPMLRYIDHLKNLRSLRDSVQFNQMDSQNISRETGDKRYSSNLEMLNKLHSDNKNELNRLLQSIESMPNETYKHRHSQEFIHHSKFHDHTNRDHRQYLSASDLSHSHHYHLNSSHLESHTQLKPDRRNVHSEVFSPSTSLSVSDAQLNRHDARDAHNFYSSDNFIDNEAELNQEYSEHVKASYSLPMALNNTDIQSIKSKSHHPPKKKTWKVDSQTQLGVTVRDSKIQCNPTMYDVSTFIQDEIFSTTGSSIASSKQFSKSMSPQKYQLDAQTQIGVLFKDSSTQSEMNSTFSVPVSNPTRKKPKKLLIDSMTQIGCFTESVSTQANLEKKTLSQNAFQMDAMTQISTLVNDRIVQTVAKSKPKKMKRDCQTQIGTLKNEMVTQTNIHCKSKAIQKSTLQLDAITQLSILNKDADLQTDPIGEDFLDEVDLLRSGPRKTVIYIRDNSTDMDSIGQRKNKRIQFGKSKLFGEGEFSSQTNYHLIEANVQTNNEVEDYATLSENGMLEYEILTQEPKQTIDVEIQSDLEIVKQKGKKVQIGSSKLLETCESSCQIGTVLHNSELQTDDKLKFVIQANEKSSPIGLELKDESTQWGIIPIDNEIEHGMKKNKKLQIGNSRLEGNLESSCQTGHVVDEFHTQTEELLFMEPMGLLSKEIQSDIESADKYQIRLEMKGKKVQVGYPQTYDRIDVECQVQSSFFEAETETISLARNEFEMNEREWTVKTTENKETQIGCSRLEGDFETSCQTGHIVKDFESQTENDYTEHQIQLVTMANNLQAVKSQMKGKKVQVGYPQLNMSFEFGSQFGEDLNDATIQTDSIEEYINPMTLTDGEIQWNDVEEGSQSSSGLKSKKLQAGSSRLNADYEASCQTGHIVNEIETQTEFFYKTESILPKEYSNKETQPESEMAITKGKKIQVGYPHINKISEKEIQIEIDITESSIQTDQIGSEKEMINQRSFGLELIDEELQYYGSLQDRLGNELFYEGKNVQSGSPKLFMELDESCQIGYVKHEAECQTDNEFSDEELVITEVQAELQSQNVLMESKKKEYTEKEIQPILTFYKASNKGKKIQVGHPKLNEFVEVECQSEISIEEIAVQTEIDEFVIEEIRNKNELAALFVEEMIEESVQYMADDIFTIQYPKETQEKNFQVGNPRIEIDYDTSCQAGHLVRELEIQTDQEPFDGFEAQITMVKDQLESQNIVRTTTEFIEKEVQPDFVSEKSRKSKKVQVGHPRLNDNLDVECQSGTLLNEMEIQTELDEFIIEQTTQINENLTQSSEEMIEELVQYESENLRPITLKTNTKGKKLQTGSSRLENDFDSSCQTGHLVTESEVQTRNDEFGGKIDKEIRLANEQTQFQNELLFKEYVDQEVQLDIDDFTGPIPRNTKCKKVQVGYPRLNLQIHAECQSEIVLQNEDIQTENDELLHEVVIDRNLEAFLVNKEMINETTQCNFDLMQPHDGKLVGIGKKLQVGTSRLEYDFDASCQTGHIVKDECDQTEIEETVGSILIESKLALNEFQEMTSKDSISLREIEIQTDDFPGFSVNIINMNKSKKVQVGHPRLNEILDVECQSGCIMDDIGVQCEVDEFMIEENKEQNLEASLFIEDLIDEATQYDDEPVKVIINSQREQKGKKLQVGIPRLDGDFEVSCQTGRIIKDSECQTDLNDSVETLTITMHSKDFSEKLFKEPMKEYYEKEIQCETPNDSTSEHNKANKSKKVQVGHPRLNEILDVECQSGCIMDDIGVQCEVDEFMIEERKEKNLEESLFVEDLIEEATQYDEENLNVTIGAQIETKGKKLQVGIPRLDVDFEVSCQTGHLIIDSECQTEIDNEIDTLTITMHSKDFSEKLFKEPKNYLEKEIQFETAEVSDSQLVKTKKSKKIQVGHPRLNKSLEGECQSGCIMDDIGVQCETDEFMIEENNEQNLEASLLIDDLIEENIQYSDESSSVTVLSQKEQKRKKLQVGNPRLDGDLEVSCQTGHLIIDSQCQTEFDWLPDTSAITLVSKDFNQVARKYSLTDLAEKEIQFELIDDSFLRDEKCKKSKKIQVGFSKLSECSEAECQTGCLMDDTGVQYETDEFIIIDFKEDSLETSLRTDNLIHEEIQYDDEDVKMRLSPQAEHEGKIIQAGFSKLGFDLEASCQTGHLIIDSECQTEFDNNNEIISLSLNYQDFSEESSGKIIKYFDDKEIQFDALCDSIPKLHPIKSKKIQVGHTRLNDYREVECQSGCIMDDVEVQTEVDEFMIMERKERNLEESLFFDDLIDESTQFDGGNLNVTVAVPKEIKGKKLQVGSARLYDDFDVSCQTGHLIMNSECQTEIDNEIDTLMITMHSKDYSERLFREPIKYFEKEIQFETTEDSYSEHVKASKSKKVQVGHPRLNENLELECQSGCLMDDIGVQCEVNEIMIMGSKEQNLEASRLIDDLIEESTQYDGEVIIVTNAMQKEVKGKKLQVGTSKLEGDLEVSCQTGHLIIDSECQTEFDDLSDTVTITLNSKDFGENKEDSLKEYLEKEIQFETTEDSYSEHVKANKSKKVQVGHPRLNENLEVECQSGCLMDDIGVQCEIDEFMIMETKERNLEASLFVEDLIDEATQYDDKNLHFTIAAHKDVKGKKLQVGTPRLDADPEVSCQTGHLIMDSGNQTDIDDTKDKIIITAQPRDFSVEDKLFQEKKIVFDKEIQFETTEDSYSEHGKSSKSKKVQVGHPRLNENLEVECQSGCLMDDIGVQCEVNEIMIMGSKEQNLEASRLIDDLIEESTQYDGEVIIVTNAMQKEVKGKKLQVGTPKLEGDLEVSCQTGHLIIDSECQTEFDDLTDTVIISLNSKDYGEKNENPLKEYLEKEMQFEPIEESYTRLVKTYASKKVQVGLPRLDENREVECQSGSIMDDVEVQTEVVEVMMLDNKERSLEFGFLFDDLINESIQYNVAVKGKKLQIGSPRLDGELEVSCQTGHLILDSHCQTDLDELTDTFIITNHLPDFTERLNREFLKEFAEKEVQYGDFDDYSLIHDEANKSKKVQVGHPRLNESLDVECQTGCLMDDIEVQCKVEEFMIMENKVRNLEANLFIEDLIEESTQYDEGNLNITTAIHKEVKGKKLQVGTSRLDSDLEVSCQTGHLITESECQTEFDEKVDEITFLLNAQDFSEEKPKRSVFEFVNKEIQFEASDDTHSISDKSNKSKKVQVGHAKLHEGVEVECQSGYMMDEIGVQCELDEFMIMENKERNLEASLLIEDLIEESTQYDDENLNVTISVLKETKGKKLQVGCSKLDEDLEVSCQTGRLIMNSECQTEFNEQIIITMNSPDFTDLKIQQKKDFMEKEMQCDSLDNSLLKENKITKSMKVQMGLARINECREVECQSGCMMDDVGVQCDINESEIIESRERKIEASLFIDDLIDETTQSDDLSLNVRIISQKEYKGKKLQVGSPRLELDSDMSCQVGHLVFDSECQTESFDSISITKYRSDFSEVPTERHLKDFVEKEIQFELLEDCSSTINNVKISKNVQVGQARLAEGRDVECQAVCMKDDVGVQNEVDEIMIMTEKENHFEERFVLDLMIDETTQYGDDIIVYCSLQKDLKNKKLQVGNSRLDIDSEVSCQTGHFIMDSECQTEVEDSTDMILITHQFQNFEEERKPHVREFVEKEIQSEFSSRYNKPSSSQVIQVGLSKLNEYKEVECQSEFIVFEMGVQTEAKESMIIVGTGRNVDQDLLIYDLIEETVQYNEDVNEAFKKLKGKKLQVGNPYLDSDSEVSCQTGHLLIESECQTELGDEFDTIIRTEHTQDFSEELMERPMKEFVEKEIQFETTKSSLSKYNTLENSKKVQVGQSRLVESREVGCQSEYLMNDIGVETEERECWIMEAKYNQENLSVSYEMIEEIIQYFSDDFTDVPKKKDQKGKKLQAGSSRLLGEMDLLCQTGHLMLDNECQTNKMTTNDIMENFQNELNADESFATKSLSNQESQYDLCEETVLSCQNQALQVGFPKLHQSQEISCQSTVETVDAVVQSESVLTNEEYQLKKQLCQEVMIEETVQYVPDGFGSISMKPNTKDRAIQNGNSRIQKDIDASYQTEGFTNDSICQTDYSEEENQIDLEIALNQYQANEVVVCNSIEIQSDGLDESLVLEDNREECGVQIGPSRINLCRTIDSQTQFHGEDVGVQGALDEALIIETTQQNVHSKLIFEDLIVEEIQFNCLLPRSSIKKDSKGKKLQVGNSRLLDDSDEFTQTELNDSRNIEDLCIQQVQSFQNTNTISFSDKEVEPLFDEEVEFPTTNVLKSHSVQVGYPRLNASVDFEGQYSFDIDFDRSDHFESSEIEDRVFSKEQFDELIDETVQYSIGMQSSTYPSSVKVNKKLQVGSSRLEVDHDQSCQTIKEETEKEIKHALEPNEIQYSNKQTEPDYPMVSEFAMFKSAGVGVGKTDAFQNFDHRSRNVFRDNQSERLISVGTATWDYDKNKYKLLTIDLQYGTELVFKSEKQQTEDQFAPQIKTKSVECFETPIPTVNKSVQVETELTDSVTQTSDYSESHSVSIQISPKVSKFENEAHLILNYFNKQVDIRNDNFTSITTPICDLQPTQFISCDIEKDFRTILCDKMIQYSRRHPICLDKLTDFQLSTDMVEFDQQHNTKLQMCDRLVSYLARKSTSEACFEYDFFAGKSLTDISMIPSSNTKDFINLFESSAIQQERKSSDIENLSKKKSSNYFDEFPDSLEINLVPKLITIDSKSIKLIDEEVMYEDPRSYIEVTVEHDSSIDASYISNLQCGVNKDDSEANLIESETQMKLESLLDDKTMLKSDKSFIEFSVNHDCNSDNLVDSKIILENTLTEAIEISLIPKLISNQSVRKTESILTEVKIPETKFKPISSVDFIQFDNKMTSTPELVEKSNFGTQIYAQPAYDGQTQTNISSSDFGTQVTDSSSISPLTVSIPLYSTDRQSVLASLGTATHNSIATDAYFEDDYIVECVKSRSIVTKKQEVLPKFSHDFTDIKEEPAKLFVTYQEKTKPKLCDTKTQSYHSDHCKDSCSQTHLELCFRDDELMKVYKKLISSKHLKEQGVQESNADGLFEFLAKTKGLRYILNKYQSACTIHDQSNQTEQLITMNSTRTQYDPENVKSLDVKPTNSMPERLSVTSAGSMISSFNSRPSHKNKRVQRGCSFFKLKDANTNTDESLDDHIEVTYTETILEESVITKRPLSKMDDHYDFSKSSSLTRRSASSTSIPVSNQTHRYIQTLLYPSQIFIAEENCDQYLTIIKSYHVTAVYDYSSRKYQSLRDAFRTGIIDLENDKYRQSSTEFISIETALEKGFLIMKHDF